MNQLALKIKYLGHILICILHNIQYFFPNLQCCIYGHEHYDTVSDLYGDGLMFYAIDCANHRNYRIFTFTPNGYAQEQIFY